MNIIVGIDTSCYTTSIAVMDVNKELIMEHRQLLRVPSGKRGLKQSEAVFQHVQNLGTILPKVANVIKMENIVAIVASDRPRPLENSYMPVFTVGLSQGEALAAFLQVPFFKTTHQESHLLAGLWSAGLEIPQKFLTVHLSGGTSELLRVTPKAENNGIFEIQLLGGTDDLHAGQFVDRIGVALGLPFPAGPHLEKMGMQVNHKDEIFIPTYVNNYNFSFSGGETQALSLIKQGHPKEAVARAVENAIAKTVEKVLRKAIIELDIKTVLLVGGVAANQHLRERLKFRLEHRAVGGQLFFAEPALSVDNAVGTALAGVMAYHREN